MVGWETRKDGILEVKCVDESMKEKEELVVHCKYIFACDGARSNIRENCQIMVRQSCMYGLSTLGDSLFYRSNI